MKIRPILFSPEMSAAVREGRKTMTRRIVKDGPFVDQETYRVSEQPSPSDCPYGKVGDILYGRERFVKVPFNCLRTGRATHHVTFPDKCTPEVMKRLPLKPSIHMPRDAARIWLRITNVRVERLMEITELDAEAEGVLSTSAYDFDAEDGGWAYWHYQKKKWLFCEKSVSPKTQDMDFTATDSFRTLWESINGPGSWDENPWVWVIEFEPCKNPDINATQPL